MSFAPVCYHGTLVPAQQHPWDPCCRSNEQLSARPSLSFLSGKQKVFELLWFLVGQMRWVRSRVCPCFPQACGDEGFAPVSCNLLICKRGWQAPGSLWDCVPESCL